MANPRKPANERGAALLVTLFALFLVSVLGLYITLNANTGLNISDNFESQAQATYAAIAGLNHSRALLRGLLLSSVLKGPDGRYSEDVSYWDQARTLRFRTPLNLRAARTLDILDPSVDVSGFPDDGVINTGFYEGTLGTPLVPLEGIGLSAPDPGGSGTVLTSRYFIKVSDNNGEASEIAADADDNPFIDGDGVVIVRSMGIAKTRQESTGSTLRRNSIVVFEARLKRLSTWDLGSALVVLGTGVNPVFNGGYEISGGAFPGIGTIDAIREDGIFLDETMRAAALGSGTITGGELPPPSISDITARVLSDRDRSMLLNPRKLWEFIRSRAPQIADVFLEGSQTWTEGNAPYLGSYDNTKPANAPGQDPQLTVVNGNLSLTGHISGGGLLVVTGDLVYSGGFAYNGLVLVIGSGNLNAAGSGQGIAGEMVVGKLIASGEEITFGVPDVLIRDNSRFISNRDLVRMAIGLIPASQISFREIAGYDP